jgi:hypothetical protein
LLCERFPATLTPLGIKLARTAKRYPSVLRRTIHGPCPAGTTSPPEFPEFIFKRLVFNRVNDDGRLAANATTSILLGLSNASRSAANVT